METQKQEEKYLASPLFGKDYFLTEAEIKLDAIETAKQFENSKSCGTITYGMVPAYRDLSSFADDLWRSGSEIGGYTTFEYWADTFEETIEGLGFSLDEDEEDGTVVWLHVQDCKCYEDQDQE